MNVISNGALLPNSGCKPDTQKDHLGFTLLIIEERILKHDILNQDPQGKIYI